LSPVPAWTVSFPESSVTLSLPASQTNGTIKTTDTSILDTPTRKTQQDRSRLSFLHRNKHNQLPAQLKINGNANSDDTSSIQSPSKENRRSFFGGNTRTSENGDGGDGDWVTDSGFDGGNDTTSSSLGQQDAGLGVIRRSNSLPRSDATVPSGGRIGSVRKRLSLLKLGKKASKASVVVDSVVEE
jgi:dedicator of cytokinesis protein 3